MSIFKRARKPRDVRPTHEQILAVAAEFNRGNTQPADDLAFGSGIHQQETAMRIFRHIDALEEE